MNTEHERTVIRAMASIEGWFSVTEAAVLYRFAMDAIRKFPGAAVVEIGSYHGRSTAVLVAAAADVYPNPMVTAIDPHEGTLTGLRTEPSWDAFNRNMKECGIENRVSAIRKPSSEVVWSTQPISVLFIDGLHDEASVSYDYDKFSQDVPAGGCVAFHDYSNPDYPGVRTVVDRLVAAGELIFLRVPSGLDPHDTLVVTRKRARLSVIIPTCGRESLREALESVVAAGALPTDDLIVVGDGWQPRSRSIAESFRRSFPARYHEFGPTRMVGAAQRNFAIELVTGSHVMFSDDDDRYVPGAIEVVRKTAEANPGRVLLFKEESCVARHTWGIIWKEKEIVEGNVGTQMVVAPAVPGRLGKFGSHYCGDYDFIRQTVDLYPDKEDSVVWVDSIISQLH